jgi:hypothetical protein
LLFQLVDRVGKDVQALFHDQPAENADHHVIVGQAQRAAPFQATALGVKISRSTPRDQMPMS